MFSSVAQSRLLVKNILSTQTQKLLMGTSFPSKLVYSEHGVPSDVLRKENDNIREPKENQVLLKMLASPVNPIDINVIEGKYIFKPQLPTVAGSEGVGEVISVGPGVSDLKVGDHAVIMTMYSGTWRSHLTVPRNSVLKVPSELGLVEAATLAINPCTAYRMLKDCVNLKSGDTVVQNGSNSACGQNIIQLARVWGINTVNIIRTRPNVEEVKDFLTSLGATHVLTEEEFKSTDIFKSGEVAAAKLALDCVGGQSAAALLRNLQIGSTLVVYGGMSKQPVSIPVSALIFKDIHVCGFRIAKWMEENNRNEHWQKMLDELISLMVNKELKGSVHKIIDSDNYKEALNNTITEKGMVGKKFILSFNK
ncbi:enoyl-[acyl-carrier-protein] reductase, mitochondrial-like [Anoplophora glabripennis]|uniref:enoyl-[acyl-carrier-protein] reductase, mitochondrial-like n=1 Tax=Anoplophora glabripennis TaxID=217634 RepID=UPI0008753CD1|nr:enoyl-[acyl-carrier-protein] reductase, mitochondrial-like [Anoplophora glabripennis]